MSSDTAIKVENLSKCYQIYDKPRDRLLQMLARGHKQYFREFWALKEVSFEIKKGETVGIVGRNGSGKSTLLQMICGTLNPTSGNIQTQGRIAALLELGSGFNPEFTGRENIYMNAAVLGLSKEETDMRFDDIVSFADIGDYIEQPVKTYSSGMAVRLAFAVAINIDPDILIIDEALAVGDWLFQKRCFQKIEQLVSRGITLLFVSHDQESVRTLTQRALLLNHGTALSWGTSSEVLLEFRRLLHQEEAAHFSALTQTRTALAGVPELESNANDVVQKSVSTGAPTVCVSRSEQFSFGDGTVKIEQVEVLNDTGEACSLFFPGDTIRIRITSRAQIDTDHLNVAIRIRNREGIKIYSWGTLNQDIAKIAQGITDESLFWKRTFCSGEQFIVDFSCRCTLGVNLYEIQASISFEETPNYLGQRILHWIDEAAFFHVLMRNDEYFFGGMSDLKMVAK